MNKLVLIGNGFDLAHGLKTKYSDFLLWYLDEVRSKLCSETVHDDYLMTITRKGGRPIYQLKSLKDFQDLLTNGICLYTPKNNFIKNIFLQAIDCNWVDIENQYYTSLVDIYDTHKIGHGNSLYDLKTLNITLEHIKNRLSEYLSTIEDLPKVNDEILNHFRSEFTANSDSIPPNDIMILNFNYTSTIEIYKKSLPNDLKIRVNYIHGILGDYFNPIIFGYGDEMDPYYEKIEQLNNNDFTKNMKSFDYLRTRNYQDFLRFIESGPFEVIIMGHSCGLSDRILLNTIFEHTKCQRIKIYYHQKEKELDDDDFTEKTQEISRHFKPNAKGDMRRKIVPREDCKPLTTPDFQIYLNKID